MLSEKRNSAGDLLLRDHYIGELDAAMDGREVVLAGWVHEVRETSKITFLLLRDASGIIQIVGKKGVTDDAVIKAMSLQKESVVLVRGTVVRSREAKSGFEILPREVVNLNPLSAKIPFEVTGKVPAEIDVRLDNRTIDLRRMETAAIFRIESTILNAFIGSLQKKGFEQIRTPCIIAESSEGGADLFPVAYFEKNAYLAQSPQLYKQLAVIGGMEKVCMIMPVFRAEKSNTTSHLTEITQMDIEMAFANADDVIRILIETVEAMVKAVIEHNKRDLEILGVKLEVPKARIVTYGEAIEELKKKNHSIEFGHDFSKEHEKAFEEIFGEAVVIRDFPASVRAFYSMPMEDNPELTHSFDYIYKGLEICSGAQRTHNAETLIQSLKKKGMNPKNFEFYINAFRLGAPPHAGWSIGLERFAMLITGAKNVRECALFPRDRKRLTP